MPRANVKLTNPLEANRSGIVVLKMSQGVDLEDRGGSAAGAVPLRLLLLANQVVLLQPGQWRVEGFGRRKPGVGLQVLVRLPAAELRAPFPHDLGP